MSLVLALLFDALVGEPEVLWRRIPHPVVLIGRAVDALDRRLNTGLHRRLKGAVTIVALACLGAAVAYGLAALPRVGLVFEVLLGAMLLAQRSLVDHVEAVAAGLDIGLNQGRQAVAHIVGRDPDTLDEAGVARAAIESCAENFSDGVVAPAFWFAVAGLPGIVAYKIVNTADSMIGHRTDRHREFGWVTARLDDLVNLVPARLAGALICLASRSKGAFQVMLRDAGKHNSPNAGWPEAALGAALGVALAGPRTYGGKTTQSPYMNEGGRVEATADDVRDAVRIIWRAWGWVVTLAILLALFHEF